MSLPPRTLILTPEVCGLPPLTAPQIRFLTCPRKECLFLGGFSSGKTTVGLYWALLQAHMPQNIGRTVGVLTPTYDLVNKVHLPRIEEMGDAITNHAGWRAIRRINKSELYVDFACGGRITFMSYEKGYTRMGGHEYCAALIDEPDKELGGDAPYSYLRTRLRGKGTLQLRATTTANGYQGVTRIFDEGAKDPERAHLFGVVKAPTSSNPCVTAEQIALWKSSMGATDARQLIDCIVTRPGDAVYDEFDEELHATQWWPQNQSTDWYASVDWGFAHAHIVYGVRDSDGRIVILGEWGADQTTTHATVAALEAIAKAHFGGRHPRDIFPDRADMPTLHPEDRGNSLLRRAFPRSRILTPSAADQHAIWPQVRRVKMLLQPAEGPPKLVFHSRLRNSRDAPAGTTVWDAMAGIRRRRSAGVPIDDVAPNQPRTEHAFDATRYLVVGMTGGFGGRGLTTIGAV